MKITVKKLKELGTYDSGIEYFESKHSGSVELTNTVAKVAYAIANTAYATNAVYFASYAVADAFADKNAMMIKTLQYGITLLKTKKGEKK